MKKSVSVHSAASHLSLVTPQRRQYRSLVTLVLAVLYLLPISLLQAQVEDGSTAWEHGAYRID